MTDPYHVDPLTLTVPEAAQRLGRSRDFIRRLIADHQVAATKHRGRWYLNTASLDAWVAMGSVAPTSPDTGPIRVARPLGGTGLEPTRVRGCCCYWGRLAFWCADLGFLCCVFVHIVCMERETMMARERKLVLRTSIKDCRVDTFAAGGPGGQHQNKTSSAVRVVHPPSGAVGESREERSQLLNKRKAFRRMAESQKFQRWARAQALNLRPVDDVVDEWMRPENLRIEEVRPR